MRNLAAVPSQDRATGGGAGADDVMAALAKRPFTIALPAKENVPFVFASPHSGQTYPPSFLETSCLDRLTLRRSEDAFVDELFAAAPHHGACLLAAHFPRAYLDVNRAENEIDPAMFEGGVPVPFSSESARVAAGLGVIPKVVRDGIEIYRARLPQAEAAFRLEKFYRPYHAALTRLVAEAKAAFGQAILVDCHSMPPIARGYDIVLGDCHGEACTAALSDRIEESLRRVGFAVGRNSPYAGGYTTRHYGRPREGIFALQIEIDRGLYLDEGRMEKSSGFAACSAALERFIADAVDACAG